MAIYRGSCGVLTQVACISDNTAPSNNVVQILSSSMLVGQKYYVRVSARGTNSGTFKLCVNSYTSAGSPSGDCQSAVILCDDRPFTVSSVRDRGAVLDNINDAFVQIIWVEGRPLSKNNLPGINGLFKPPVR